MLSITWNMIFLLLLFFTDVYLCLNGERERERGGGGEGGRKEMFYLTTHSTLRLYGVRQMKPAAATCYSYRLAARVLLYAPSHRQENTIFVRPVMDHWLERVIAHWVSPMKDRSDDPSLHERTLLPRSYISLRKERERENEWMMNEWRFNDTPPQKLHQLLSIYRYVSNIMGGGDFNIETAIKHNVNRCV